MRGTVSSDLCNINRTLYNEIRFKFSTVLVVGCRLSAHKRSVATFQRFSSIFCDLRAPSAKISPTSCAPDQAFEARSWWLFYSGDDMTVVRLFDEAILLKECYCWDKKCAVMKREQFLAVFYRTNDHSSMRFNDFAAKIKQITDSKNDRSN